MLLDRIRRQRKALTGLFFLAAVSGCADQLTTEPGTVSESTELPEELRPADAPRLSTTQNSPPSLQTCGNGASYVIWGGSSHFPGKVQVSNDAQNLYVTYTIDAEDKDWYITDTRLLVTKSIHNIPLDAKKLPNPWAFPLSGVHSPAAKTYTYIVPLSQSNLKAGDRVIVAAMAGVVRPKTPGNLSGAWEWSVGWGLGNVSGRTINDIANYTVGACANAPTPPVQGVRGAITITFDDGFKTTITNAFPVMRELGLTGNVAINPVPIDETWGDYMNIADVRTLHNAGWAVVSHSMTHRSLPTLTETELRYELDETKKWIQRNGFRGSHVFIVPFHEWGAREKAIIPQYYKAARGLSATQFSPIVMVPFPFQSGKMYELTGYEPEFAPYTTVDGRALTRDFLEKAVADGEFIDIFFHRIPAGDVPAFREMMKVLAEFKSYIKTYDQIVPA